LSEVSRPGLAGAAVGLAGFALAGFVVVRPNRLAPGEPMGVFQVLPAWQWGLFLAGFALLVLLCFRPSRRGAAVGTALPPAMVLALLWSQGVAASRLAAAAGEFARASLGASLWLAILGLFIVFTDMAARLKPGPWAKAALSGGFIGGLALLAAGGVLDELSLALEFAAREERFFSELRGHLFITGLSVGLSGLIGLPIGLLVFKRARMRTSAFSLLNIVQTIPSLALFGLLIAPLAWLSSQWALLRGLGVRGIGWAPAVIALTLYALLPIVRNTFSGFAAVDKGVLEAGRGMGMGKAQMFFKVELPLAAPIILNGLRIASVQNIGNTAVAALIGAGGFGVFIFQGLGQAAIDLVLLGAVPTILLAVLADHLFQLVIRALSPEGLS
jgi:osmoprotectant transport system permease protein